MAGTIASAVAPGSGSLSRGFHSPETGAQWKVFRVRDVTDVVLLRWPAELDRRERLAVHAVPRLLLVEGGADPPPADCLEDWIRVPAADGDVQRRIEDLLARAAHHVVDVPELDGDGVLRFGDSWTSLPPVDARLAGALVDRFGAVVNRAVLGRAGWPTGPPGRNALDVHMLRLRRRLEPLGLVIRTVRSRGYLMEGPARGRMLADA
jgi:hypothetical protein